MVDWTLDPELWYSAWQAGEELTRQKNVVIARKYYDGEHEVPLTKRQKEFLGFQNDERFALNYCKTVVSAVAERMKVTALAGDEKDPFAAWAWDQWEANRMDAKQDKVHRAAIKDGETFLLVDWDEDKGMPTLLPHPRYTDAKAEGTGYGCKAFYEDDDPGRELLRVSKRWTERVLQESGRKKTIQRMNVYYPDRVEKYINVVKGKEGWEPYQPEGEAWPLPWPESIGIPWIHFLNPDGKTELWDAIPVQDLVNKTALDILAAADAAGFRIIITDFIPTDDGKPPANDKSNYLKLSPGCYLVKAEGGEVDVLEAAKIEDMLTGLDSWIVKLAQVTDTPTSRFQLSRQIAAEGTLKQQEAPLLAKVQTRQTTFGNCWEDAFYIARNEAREFGNVGELGEGLISTEWAPAATRDEKEYREGLKLESELGVPNEKLWAKMGYDAAEIAEMKAMRAEELQQTSNVGGELLRAFEQGA